MTTYLKKIKLSTALILVAVVISVVGVSAVTKSYSNQGQPVNVFENVESLVLNQEAPAPVEEVVLGAVASPHLLGPEFGVGKDWQYSVTAELADATTTWAFVTPFRAATTTNSEIVVETLATGYGLTAATSTVELVRFDIASSTATGYSIGCGSSASKFTTTTQSIAILTADGIPAAWDGGVIENGLATTAGAQVGGGNVTKIQVGPSHPYIVCRVYTTAAGQFTGADGVSLGDIAIRFSKVQ